MREITDRRQVPTGATLWRVGIGGCRQLWFWRAGENGEGLVRKAEGNGVRRDAFIHGDRSDPISGRTLAVRALLRLL